jgi:hypothetical protein
MLAAQAGCAARTPIVANIKTFSFIFLPFENQNSMSGRVQDTLSKP